MSTLSFKDEIASLEKTLESARTELQRLEEQYKSYDVEFADLRAALENLQAAAEGRSLQRAKTVRKVKVKPDTGRPARGARRDQLLQICRRLGRGGKEFRTIDVLERVAEVEGELSAGIRSYTYSMMKTFADDGEVVKVGRGTWRLP